MKCVNGQCFEMTQAEIDEVNESTQRDELEKATKYELTKEEIIKIIASNINVYLPNETKRLSEVINSTIELPYKVGYRWELQGNTFVSVKDENAIGTIQNPIIYHEGVQMFDNAFYKKDGKLHVYMSGELIEW